MSGGACTAWPPSLHQSTIGRLTDTTGTCALATPLEEPSRSASVQLVPLSTEKRAARKYCLVSAPVAPGSDTAAL